MALTRILSIDGGGIRGILPGQILVALEKKIQKKTGNPNARIGEYFDMIAGTSTGGILASMLLCPSDSDKTRAKYSALDAVNTYVERGGEIFSKGFMRSLFTADGITEELYSAKNLEKILKEKLGENTMLSELIKPCLITAYDIENRCATFFNKETAENPDYDFKVWEIARSTSAAPTYFEPAQVTSQAGNQYAYVDGGVFANNPTMCAYAEARNIFSKKGEKPLRAKDLMVVSIGTGSIKKAYMYKDAKDWGMIKWIKPIIDILMSGSAETVDFQLKHIFEAIERPDQYQRISPSIGGAGSDMDDASDKNIQNLKIAGAQAAVDNDKSLEKIAEMLVEQHGIREREQSVVMN